MSQVLDAPDARIRDILFEGRGTGGGFTTEAQAAALPVGRFFEIDQDYSIDDPQCAISACDRRVQLDWDAVEDLAPGVLNERDTFAIEHYTLTVHNCVIYGPDTGAHLKLYGSEDKATVKRYQAAKRRALGDAKEINRALSFKELYQGGTDPAVILIRRVGAAQVQRIAGPGGYRLIVVTVYQVTLELTAGSYRP
jgi:hypothetical protein